MTQTPFCDLTDPGQLEAWFGRNPQMNHWRKVVLAKCRELERARMESEGKKYTVDKIDDLARLNTLYTDFLLHCLEGSAIREQAWLDTITPRVGA